MDTIERDNLIVSWQTAKSQLDAAVELERNLRKQVFEVCFPEAKEGTNNLDLGMGYKLKGVKKLNYNLVNGEGETETVLDQIANLGNEGHFIAERLVGWKPALSLSEYKKLEANNPTHAKIKNMIDSVITITEGLPTVEVVEPKAKR